MKIKKKLLERIIREEIESVLLEQNVELIDEGLTDNIKDLLGNIKRAIAITAGATALVSAVPSTAEAGTVTVGVKDPVTAAGETLTIQVPDKVIDGGEQEEKLIGRIKKSIKDSGYGAPLFIKFDKDADTTPAAAADTSKSDKTSLGAKVEIKGSIATVSAPFKKTSNSMESARLKAKGAMKEKLGNTNFGMVPGSEEFNDQTGQYTVKFKINN